MFHLQIPLGAPASRAAPGSVPAAHLPAPDRTGPEPDVPARVTCHLPKGRPTGAPGDWVRGGVRGGTQVTRGETDQPGPYRPAWRGPSALGVRAEPRGGPRAGVSTDPEAGLRRAGPEGAGVRGGRGLRASPRPDYKSQGAQRRLVPGREPVAAGWQRRGSGVNKGESPRSAVTGVPVGGEPRVSAHVSAEPSARPPGSAARGGAAPPRPAPPARPLGGGHADPRQRPRPPRADPGGSWGLGGGGGGAESRGAHLGAPGHGGEGGPEHLHRLEGGKM